MTTWWLGLAIVTGLPVWAGLDGLWLDGHAAAAYLGLGGALAHGLLVRGSRRKTVTGIAAFAVAAAAIGTGLLAANDAWALVHAIVMTALLGTALYLHLGRGALGQWWHGALAAALAAALALLL